MCERVGGGKGCNRSAQRVCGFVPLCCMCVWEDEYSRLYHSRSGDCLSDPLKSD